MIDKTTLYRPLNTEPSQTVGKDIREVASEFESIFIYYMLKTMRESVIKAGLFGNSRGEEIYKSMLDEELSRIIAKGGGIGLKDIIVKEMEGTANPTAPHEPIRDEEGAERVSDKQSAVSSKPSEPILDGEGRGIDYYRKQEKGFQLPVKGDIGSGYGIRKDPITGEHRFHYGIDIPAHEGAPVYPSMEGTVIFSGERPGYGNMVEIRHDNGYITRYAHNQRNMVKEGDRVKTSDIIAIVGSTGRTTGPHLHFEVRVEGFAVNPVDMLTFG